MAVLFINTEWILCITRFSFTCTYVVFVLCEQSLGVLLDAGVG